MHPEMLVLLLRGAGTVRAVGREWRTHHSLEKHHPGIVMISSERKRAWIAFCEVPLEPGTSVTVPGSSS